MTQTAGTTNPLKQTLDLGQSIWIDGLMPEDELTRMIEEDGVRGATTNPTIFEKAVAGGVYDRQIDTLSRSMKAEEVYRDLAVEQVREIADLFRSVYDGSKGRDGFVSMEVSPLIAYDTEATVQEARELWRLIGRENAMIKVPATREGIPAIQTLISEGINVNITLIFSIARYREVMEAYLSGLEKREKEGQSLAGIASVASFFVSRVDTDVNQALEAKRAGREGTGTPAGLEGKVAIANSKIAYEAFETVFRSERFSKLERKGAALQRPLWASTSTKDPRYSDVLYVEALLGPDTVNTLPLATLRAFKDHGTARVAIKDGLAEAHRTVEALEAAGISLAAVTEALEKKGVELFAGSYKKLIQQIQKKCR